MPFDNTIGNIKTKWNMFLYFWWPSQKIWTLLQLMESNQGKSPTVQGHWKRSEFSMVYYRLRTLALKAQDDCWRRVSEDNQSYISQVFKKNPGYCTRSVASNWVFSHILVQTLQCKYSSPNFEFVFLMKIRPTPLKSSTLGKLKQIEAKNTRFSFVFIVCTWYI